MAEAPAMPFFTDAYLGDTTHLTTLEHGAYLLLLFTMWRAGGYLQNDDKMLARYTKLPTPKWLKIKPIIFPFMTVEEDRITQSRLLDELQFVKSRSHQQSENARAKSRKTKEQARAVAKPSLSHGSAPTPTPTPTPTDHPKVDDRPRPPNGADVLEAALADWNDLAKRLDLPQAQRLTDTRRTRLKARLKDVGGIDGWRIVLGMIEDSDFLRGRTKNDFKASLDFVLQESSFTKLAEGTYRTNKRQGSPAMEALRKLREDLQHG